MREGRIPARKVGDEMGSLERYLHKKVVILPENAELQQAAHAMRENEVGCVLVCNSDQNMVGILTDRDLVIRAWVIEKQRLDSLRLLDVMSRDLIHVDPRATLDQVLNLMQMYGIRRIPIIEPSHGGTQICRGIVTLHDLMMQRAVPSERVSQILKAQFYRSRPHSRKEARLPENAQMELDEFYRRLASSFGVYLDFKPPELERLTDLILRSLIQCLHRTAALHFISELPSLLQGELVHFVQAQHLSSSTEVLQAELIRVLKIDQSTAQFVLNRFGHHLEEWFDARVFQHIKAQLPRQFSILFSEDEAQGLAG